MQWLKERQQQGQAVLIVLLVVAVALGFGLSIISQSVTDIEIAGQSEESARAFNAAEAGIEEALQNIAIGSNTMMIDEDITVNYSVGGENSIEGVYRENETATVILGQDAITLMVKWADENSNCDGAETPASLLISVINSDYTITREGWNACELDNDFINVTDSGGPGYFRQKTLFVGANALVRIRPIYNQAVIRVEGSDSDNLLPVQTYAIDSQAQSPTLESKAIQVSRTIPATPSIFDYVLFSGANIIK